MSKTIDERVVSMQFDNKQFERNTAQTMSTLDKLKEKLKFKGATKGLEDLGQAAGKVSMNPISKSIEVVQAKFSALDAVAFSTLQNITNRAIATGERMVKALTIDPIATGFQEYETQMGAVQTILANTQSKGSTLQDVNRALNELNTYADKTIYNFTEMTKNIGTFTAAGVDLDKSVSSIKGIANLAAVSGSTSQQASTAMYQLSQALAAGRVSLMDWNSVVNAGMGGELFQEALKRTARNLGTGVDEAIKKYGTFRESLTKGQWLTTEVLTETLSQLSGAYTEADLLARGYTKEQAKEIVELSKTAVSAATEVKTFTQLWDTMKEAAQSGWTQTWQTIIGDFGESKELLTGISNVANEIIGASAESRNKLLTEGLSTGWKQMLNQGIADEEGFKETIKLVAKDHKVAVDDMIKKNGSFEKSLKEGWVTGDILAESLDKMTQNVSKMSDKQLKAAGYTKEQARELQDLNKAVKNGSISMDEFAKKMGRDSGRENIISGLTNIVKMIGDVIKPIQEAFREIFPPATGEQLYSFTEKFEKFTEKLKVSDETASKIKDTFKGLFSVFSLLGKVIKTVLSPLNAFVGGGGASSILDFILNITSGIGRFLTSLNESKGVSDFFGGIAKGLSSAAHAIADSIGLATEGVNSFGDVLSSIGKFISNFAGKVLGGIGSVFDWIGEHLSFGDMFAGLAGGGIFMLLKKLGSFIDDIKEKILGLFGKDDKEKIKFGEKFANIMDSVHDSLSAFSTGIKATSLLTIAAAVGILSMSLNSISKLEPEAVGRSLFAIGAMIAMLSGGFKSLTKSISKFGSKGVVKAGIALIGISTAINIFASALGKIAVLSWDDIGRGLTALGLGLIGLVGSLKLIGKSKVNLRTSIAIIALAQACSMLGDALAKFAKLSWEEIKRGLTAMGGALLELTISLGILSKVGGGGALLGSVGILIAVQSLEKISEGLKNLGSLSWDEIGRGLTAMGGALGELTIALGILSKVGGFGAILGGTAILIAVKSLDEISENLAKFGSMSWDEIGRGLTAMGGALAEVAIGVGALGKIAGFSSLFSSTSILIVVQGLNDMADGLKKFGGMSWDEIGRGLTAMGGALAEVSGITALVGKLAPLGALIGSGSLLLAVQGLGDLADAFQQFGSMSWEEIVRGLTAMMLALTEATGIPAIVGLLAPLGQAVGSGSLLLATKGLGDLADAFVKFGSMSWDEIGRGLTAMGGALAEVAIGGLLNTLSGFGAGAISSMAEPLGTLAESVQKWAGVKVPEGLAERLKLIAGGVMAFNFSGWGADAIASMAVPFGQLADSVKKWAGLVIPEGIGEQLANLATGVSKFNFAGWGADAIASMAVPFGQLADSVKKWTGLSIPENIQNTLTSLATGVKAFNFAGWASNDIADLVEPLGNLGGAISKWKDVVLPEDMGTKLSSLAAGVKAFNLGLFEDDFDIGDAIQPIKDLAGAVAAWNGVILTSTMGTNLQSLATGVKSFNNVSVNKIDDIAAGIKSIGSAVRSISYVDFSTISSSLNSFAEAISSINISADSFKNLGTKMADGMILAIDNGIITGSITVTSAVIDLLNKMNRTISSKGLESKDDFYSVGKYLVEGFAKGISDNTYIAAAKAEAMAEAADRAAREELGIESPSKEFYAIGDFAGIGFVNALTDSAKSAFSAGKDLAKNAKNGLSEAISRISDTINSDMDTQPTIRPVLDLSGVAAGANAVNGLFDMSPSVGLMANVNAVSAMRSSKRQNGTTDDVISALKDLKRSIGDSNGNSYTINGVTYDDGSNVASAVKDLIRAAKIERRV